MPTTLADNQARRLEVADCWQPTKMAHSYTREIRGRMEVS